MIVLSVSPWRLPRSREVLVIARIERMMNMVKPTPLRIRWQTRILLDKTGDMNKQAKEGYETALLRAR
jgi:hypothetical protein